GVVLVVAVAPRHDVEAVGSRRGGAVPALEQREDGGRPGTVCREREQREPLRLRRRVPGEVREVGAGGDEQAREPGRARVRGGALAARGVDVGAERGPRACGTGARHGPSVAPPGAAIEPGGSSQEVGRGGGLTGAPAVAGWADRE